MPRQRRWGAATFVVVLLAAAGAPASVTPPDATASTGNTVLRLTIGETTVRIGLDEAESRLGDALQARASFAAAQVGMTSHGTLERSGTDEGDSGRDEADPAVIAVDGLVALTLLEAAAAVDLDAERVEATANASLASISLLGGAVEAEGIVSDTATEATSQSSSSSRRIEVHGLEIFDVEGLLGALGVDPLEVPCDGFDDVASLLGIEGIDTCDQLAAALDALADARDDLAGIAALLDAMIAGHDEETVSADRAAAAALSCDPLDLVCVADALLTLIDLALEYGIDLSDPTDLETTQAEVVAALDELLAAFGDADVIDDAIAEASAGTCDATAAALEEAGDTLSAADPAGAAAVLAAAHGAVQDSCDTLRGSLADVLGSPVLRLDDVVIEIAVSAAEGETASDVTVSVGAITLGYQDAVAVVDLEEALSSSDAIAASLAAVVDALGLDAPTPEIDLFVVDRSDGQDADGVWHASASVTLLQITQPDGTLTVPDDPPFALLGDAGGSAGGGGSGALFAAPYSAILAASVPSPPMVLQAVVFDAAARYAPPGAAGDPDPDPPGSPGDPSDEAPPPGSDDGRSRGQGDAGPLPNTGTPVGATMLAAMVLLACGAALRRWMGVA